MIIFGLFVRVRVTNLMLPTDFVEFVSQQHWDGFDWRH